jgi:hypothetical protein
MFRPSVAKAALSYIMPMKKIGNLLLHFDVLYSENFIMFMAWRTSPSICRCRASAHINLTAMMIIS